jgi:hypothetical protein
MGYFVGNRSNSIMMLRELPISDIDISKFNTKRLACAVFVRREQSGDYKITALTGTAQSTF